jgi:transposase InsO family protein
MRPQAPRPQGSALNENEYPSSFSAAFAEGVQRIRRRTYRTREEARQDVFDYIEMFYNPKRKHVRNGMLSPVEFERQQEM